MRSASDHLDTIGQLKRWEAITDLWIGVMGARLFVLEVVPFGLNSQLVL